MNYENILSDASSYASAIYCCVHWCYISLP